MLYPSQQEATDLLKQRLAENRGAVVLQGLSGAGKSRIAKEATAGEPEPFILDIGMTEFRTEELRAAAVRKCRIVILAHPLWPLERLEQKVTVHPDTLRVRGLSQAEVSSWMDEAETALSAGERQLVLTYSLGFPLLVERFLAHRPVTREAALPQCAAHLQKIFSQYPGDEKLAHALAEYTDFQAPEDALALVGEPEEFGVANATPISLLQSCLSGGAELPVPATLQLYEIYQEWLSAHRDEPNFEVFIQSMPDAAQFLDHIGYSDLGRFGENELERFSRADARKGATFYPRNADGVMDEQLNNNSDSLDAWVNEHMLVLARSSGVEAKADLQTIFDRDVVKIQMPGSPSPLFLHKHDHTPLDVMPVAYTFECALQARGVPYTASYNGKLYRYDPQKKAYEPLETVKVDYYPEVYGARWASEPQDDWDDPEQPVE